ncbi:MAG: hypothetical protein AAFN12_15635 [Cyanobacteria bacterium J06560_2]
MSLITLLLTVLVAWMLSLGLDLFPGFLWSWIHFPNWFLWIGVFSLFAWSMGDQPTD